MFRLDVRDECECLAQVCHVGAELPLEPALAWRDHVLELVLGGVNVPDKLGRACGLDRAIDLLASSGQDESAAVGPVPAVEPFEPLPRGHGLVDAARATIARAGPSDGFLDGANRLTLIESSQSLLNRSSSGGSYR